MTNQLIPMTPRDLHRYHVLRLVLEHRITGGEAARSLGLSLRQVRRLLAAIRVAGQHAIVHGNRGQPSARRLPLPIQQRILTVARGRYAGLNTTHLTEKLQTHEGLVVSRPTVYRLLTAAGVARPRHRRPPRHRMRRARKPQAGLLLLWDGSPHAWLEARGPRCCLVGAMDDATGTLLPVAACVPAEDTSSYLRLLRTLVTSCGIPVAIYMDRHGIFRRNDATWTLQEELRGRQDPTQVGRALEAANAWLPGFTTAFNARFAHPAADTTPAWRPVPAHLDLDRICSFYTEATVLNDNTIRVHGALLPI